MIMCRGCKLSSTDLVFLNDNSISYFNILTNLNVQMNDELPQHLCRICNDKIYKFKEFRDICISVDTELKNNILNEVKTALELTDNIKFEYSDYEDITIYEDSFQEEEKVLDTNVIPIRRSSRFIKPKNVKHLIKICKEKANQVKNKALFKGVVYNCGLCTEVFTNESSRKNHLDGHKTNNNCSICHKKFSNQVQTLAHRITHLPTDQRNCFMCSKKFRNEHYLEFHYRKHHFNETNINLECYLCNRTFRAPKYVARHLLESHSDRILICDYCKNIYKTRYALVQHMEVHYNRRKYKCSKCDFAANSRSSLRIHDIGKHTIGKVNCKLCKMPCKSKEHFDKHKCKPQNSQQVCPVCGKIVLAFGLQRHLLSHSTEKKYKCHRCPATYKQRNGLRDHLNAHDGIRKYKCEYCPKVFGTGSVLIKHRRIHTGEKPFVCSICQKGFTGNNNLKVHMKVHGITNLIVKKNQDGATAHETNICTFS